LVLHWCDVVLGVVDFGTHLYLRAHITACGWPYCMGHRVVFACAATQSTMTPNSAAHPEPKLPPN
jgi:hypothetical protein